MISLSCEAVARTVLGQPVKKQGSELFWSCVHPERHNNHDAHPSLRINTLKNLWQCPVCGVGGTPWQLAAFIAHLDPGDKTGIAAWLRKHGLLNGKGPKGAQTRQSHEDKNGKKPPAEHCNTATLTIAQYAEAKKLPLDFLRGLRLSDMKYQGTPAVRIPYFDDGGAEAAVRFRMALEKSESGDDRFLWRKGSKPGLYACSRCDPSWVSAKP